MFCGEFQFIISIYYFNYSRRVNNFLGDKQDLSESSQQKQSLRVHFYLPEKWAFGKYNIMFTVSKRREGR